MPSAINVTFLGHSAWQIEHGAHTILVDPFITGNPIATTSAAALSPTHILLTHAHGDHLGDTEELAKRTGATVISTFEVANWLAARGCEKTMGMGLGGGRELDFGHLKLTIAHHSSSAPDGTPLGNPAGFLITIDGRTIYHAGDTALFYDMKLIGDRHEIDLALLPIGDYFTMGPDDAVAAVEFLRPKLTVPMHYNTFPPITVDAGRFKSECEARGFSVVLMNPGDRRVV